MPALPSTVVAELRGLPLLADAACRGLGGLWDDHLPDEHEADRIDRHALAARVCRTCRARPACAQLASALGDQAVGVWAGRVHRTRPAA